jgi:YVTN family beta-propeller protein
MDPSGKFAYVANAYSNNASGYTIDPGTGALTPITSSPFAAGTYPVSVAVTRAKLSVRAVYTTNAGANTVSVISSSTNTVLTTVRVGPRPVDAAVTPNGATA